jgi:SulP family sulfate permease
LSGLIPGGKKVAVSKRDSQPFWLKFLPFMGWLGELKNKDTLRADLIAGITVALVLVPQSMAYAQLAGLPVYYGLYASFLPPMVAALFGSSRQLATGPVAVVSLMTAAALGPLAAGNPEGYLAYAVLLAFMVGAFQLFLGVFRLGVLVDFLSHPVVLGFTNAGAIIIATSQLSKLFGVTVEKAEHHYETVMRVVEAAMAHTHMPTLWMGLLSIAIMYGLKKYLPKIPNVLVAVAITTVLAWYTDFKGAGGAVVGSIPEGLPGFALPVFDWDVMQQLIATAITISLIGFMEAIAIAKAMAARTRQRLDTNQELVGQGLSNMVAGCFSGYPGSGSFSRSAVNINAGAETGFSSVVTGIVVGVTLLFLTPLLYHLPQATLASVIIMAVINLVKFKPIVHAYKAQPHDGIVAVITFVLTLAVAPHLDQGPLACSCIAPCAPGWPWYPATPTAPCATFWCTRSCPPARRFRCCVSTARCISPTPVISKPRCWRWWPRTPSCATSSSTLPPSTSWMPPARRCSITWRPV